MKVMFNNRGLLMLYDESTNMYIVQSKAEQRIYDNPLIAWNDYITALDNMVRKQIGNLMEKQHRDRYTGERIVEEGENEE